jgi:hypothetical protein
MLVVIPTYRRNECLQWVLQSLVQSDVSGVPEPIRVAIVNNYPPASAEIAQIVSGFSHHNRFEWNVVYRERTLDPVDNWYSAIAENARPDEVVFLHSDDDIFLPWSLGARYSAISKLSGDALLARTGPPIYFLENATRMICPSVPGPVGGVEGTVLSPADVAGHESHLLSNHCYRYTDAYRRGLERGMAWCNALEWLDYNTRTLFLPTFLPLAIMTENGRVLGLDVQCTLRGQDLDEVGRAPFGVANWNPGFISLPAWFILQNTELGPMRSLNGLREVHARSFIAWFLTYGADRRVGVRKVMAAMRRTGFPWRRVLSPTAAYGLRLLAGEWLRLRGRRMRQRIAEAVPGADFMRSLQQLAMSGVEGSTTGGAPRFRE